jgi:hypothetical protein
LDENQPRPWALPFFVALAPLTFLAWRLDFLVDDAFISFRYAQNLAGGHGLVFNPGEAPRVEGYTNLLWTLALAGVHAAKLDPAIWARALSLLSAAGLLALVTRFLARNVFERTAPAAMGAAFFATLPPVSVWATGGLETMPFALAVFAVFERLLADAGRPHAVQAGLAGAAAVLLRADGFVWVGIALGAAALFRAQDRPRLWRAVLTAAVLAGVVSAVHFLWRQSYYGEWLPNTSRAKVHLGTPALERGSLYVASMLLAIPSIPIALLHALGCLGGTQRAVVGPALVAVLGGFAYTAVVGGDWMMMYRMLVPTLPFVAVAFGAVLATIRDRTLRRVLFGASLVLSLLPAFDRHPIPESVRALTNFRWGQEYRTEYAVWHQGVVDIEDWILLGKALGAHTQPGESIIPPGNIGAIPYYSGLIAYDTLGLTNREPFVPVVPGEQLMAGHERKVDVNHLRQKFRPTYRGAQLAPADDEYAGLPEAWTDPKYEISKTVEIEIVPLDPAAGFPEDTVLQLVRNRW